MTVIFAGAYLWMSMRKQKPTTLTATHIGPISYDLAHFGNIWFWSNVGLDVLLGFMSAACMVWTIRRLQARRSAKGGAASTAGALAIAFATFGCPTCTLPLAGTLGIGVFASTLPLIGTEFKILAALPLALSMVLMKKADNAQTSCQTQPAL
jgi:hypothetical protein